MTDIDEHGRPEPPPHGDEVDALVGFLDRQRSTLEWKCAGVTPEGLRTTTAASTMTLGGLLKHMAFVEDYWLSYRLHGHPPVEPWRSADWQADRDWEWTSAAEDSPDQLWSMWRSAVDRSRELASQALAAGGLDQTIDGTHHDGRTPNVRWVLLHMIEEYARHNGHADLLREAYDGATGE